MSSNSETIKDYLIGLGFECDEAQVKKFDNFIEGTGKKLAGFGQIAIVSAAGIQASVTEIAADFERLYYASQRTGTSVGAIQALRFGAEQVGVSAESATAALETMVRTMQLQPGTASLLAHLGVDPNQADKTKAMLDLIERLRKMPPYIGSQYARMFGIDDRTFQMLSLNLDKMKEAEATRKRLAAEAGVNPEQLAKDSREFMNQTRELEAMLSLFGMQVESSLLPVVTAFVKILEKLQGSVNGLNKWAKENVPGGAALPGVEGVAGAVGTAWLGKKILSGLLSKLGIGTAASAAEGAAGAGTAAVAAEATAAAAANTASFQLALGSMSAGTTAAAAEGSTAAAATTGLLAKIAGLLEGMAAAIGTTIAGLLGIGASGITGGLLAYFGIKSVGDKWVSDANAAAIGAQASYDAAKRRNSIGIRQHNPGNLRVPGKDQFQSFNSDYEGFVAMVRQILIDSRRGQNSVATLLGGINGKGGWSPGKENDLPRLIKEMSARLHVGAGTQLNLNDPKLLAMVAQAIAIQEVGTQSANGNLWDINMIQKAALEAQARSGGKTVTIHQENHTQVSGVPDAHGVKHAVDQSHSQALRDLKGAVD